MRNLWKIYANEDEFLIFFLNKKPVFSEQKGTLSKLTNFGISELFKIDFNFEKFLRFNLKNKIQIQKISRFILN